MRRFFPFFFAASLALCNSPEYLPQDCPVYEGPFEKAPILCVGKRRELYEVLGSVTGDFFFVKTPSCLGFLKTACIKTPRSSISFQRSMEIATALSFELPIINSPSGDQGVRGTGHGLSIGLRFQSSDFRLGLSYEYRRFDVITQTEKYWGYGALFGYLLESQGEEFDPYATELWLDAGGEYLYPMGTNFSHRGNLFLFVAGLSADFRVGYRYWTFGVIAQGFHNFASLSTDKLMGLRVGVTAAHDLF